MEAASHKDNHSVLSSPFSSPNVSALLKIKIISWIQETGLPVAVCVRVAGRTFNLHKYPLFTKSGYFNKKLSESNEIELPQNFPGGAETFEMIALFIYGSSTLVDPFNVSSLRCASEFLEMTEEYGAGNLCQRFDIYLNQVVFQTWDDTLIVLQKCQTLLPLAEELLIISRCIESLAFMACMEILDPERRRDLPMVSLEGLTGQRWSSDWANEILNRDLWIKDLIALPFGFFKRIIGSLRRQGMKEKYVSPIILFFINKWILSKKTSQDDDDSENKISSLFEEILDILPMGEKANRVIPVGFYFVLLKKALKLRLGDYGIERLKEQIVLLLHLADSADFLLPKNGSEFFCSSFEFSTMESIFSLFVVRRKMESNHSPSDSRSCLVAELWDDYLKKIGMDREIGTKRFMELVEIVPISWRESHDHLYKALNNFLEAHPNLSQEEKNSVCKYLNCHKLSQEASVEAVQNEQMPLRLIVQALFLQQLHTQEAFKHSFRYGEFSGSSLHSSTTYPNSKSPNLGESPFPNEPKTVIKPAGFLLRDEYESTSFRIQNLEQEIVSLKKSLQMQKISKKPGPVLVNSQDFLWGYGFEGRKKRNMGGEASGCIGSVNFATQRKYASRLLKVFRRITLFGRGKSKRKPIQCNK